ncbi:dolichol-phosphate mannosyltransferase [Lachnospiraceae bacterium XPB1003]|nr:dolichol-phosphate mannosyltransferase [Lachnospiraceae bacterium XPB1003]
MRFCIIYPMIKNIAALIPAYNPDREMTKLTEKLVKEFEHIVVVDDGCAEEYGEIFDTVAGMGNITILHHEVNKGKGCALKTGFRYILDNLKDVCGVVTLDADGQHTVEDTKRCCERFLSFKEEKDKYPVIFGCRDFRSDTKIPPRSRFGNRLTSRLMKFFCDISLSDTQTGLRVLACEDLEALCEVKGERYEYEMNMIFELHDMGVPFDEVQIEVIYLNENESSHFNPIKDSIKIYKVFLKFCLSSFGSAALDLILFAVFSAVFKSFLPVVSGSGKDAIYAPVCMLFGRWAIDHVAASVVIARIFSGIFNFNINRLIFKSKAKDAVTSGPKYFLIWIIQMALSAGLVSGLVKVTHLSELLVKIVVDTILFFISYKIQQLWVFKKKRK